MAPLFQIENKIVVFIYRGNDLLSERIDTAKYYTCPIIIEMVAGSQNPFWWTQIQSWYVSRNWKIITVYQHGASIKINIDLYNAMLWNTAEQVEK